MSTVISVTWEAPHRVLIDEYTPSGNHGEQWTLMQTSHERQVEPHGFVYWYKPEDSLPDSEIRLPKNWIIV